MKQRFTFLDLRAIVNELSPLITNKYIQNIYSQGQKLISIKLSSKDIILIEPGIRMHLTDTYPTDTLSHFTKVLRATVRHSKILKIYQVGFDRIIVIEISGNRKIVVEFYANGNILLVGEGDTILQVYRTVDDIGIVRGEGYNFNYVGLDYSYERYLRVKEKEFLGMDECVAKGVFEIFNGVVAKSGDKVENAVAENKKAYPPALFNRYFSELRIFISTMKDYGVIFYKNGLPDTFHPFCVEKWVEHWNACGAVSCDGLIIRDGLGSAKDIGDTISKDNNSNDNTGSTNVNIPGIVDINKGNTGNDNTPGSIDINTSDSNNALTNVNTSDSINTPTNVNTPDSNNAPININTPTSINTPTNVNTHHSIDIPSHGNANINTPLKSDSTPTKIFPSFNQAVLTFFTTQKPKKEKKEKKQKIKDSQQQRIEDLQSKITTNEQKAQLIENNTEKISYILQAVKFCTANRVKIEIPGLKEIDYAKRTCTVELEGSILTLFYEESVYFNVDAYYSNKKKAVEKIGKTQAAMERMSISASKKKEEKMNTGTAARKRLWFEKFNFFISSDSFLIIGGKTAQQNEMVVKKYLDATDLYFHGDVRGASSVVVKNMKSMQQVPQQTISEAALMALCMSKCWDTGVVSPVWYVYPSQVSKSAPTGEYLKTGGFVVRGRKNYVDAYRLEYGIGLLFRIKGVEKEEAVDEMDVSVISELTPSPSPTDSILYALPVCAPWQIIKTYKFKERLVPGTSKKGRMVEDIVKKFGRIAGEWEREAVRGITVAEYLDCLISHCKIGKS